MGFLKSTKQLTDIALLTALYMILFAIVFFIPLIGTLFVWVLPLPFIFAVVRNGRNTGIIMLVLALVLTMIFGLAGLPFTWTFASVGVVLGEFYHRKKSAFQHLLAGTLSYIVNFVLLYIFFILITGINPVHDFVNALKDTLLNSEQMVPAWLMGANEGQIDVFVAQLDLMTYLIPSMLIIAAFLFALLTQLVANGFLKRFRYDTPRWKPFREWSLPKNVIWYYLIVLILSLIGFEVGSTLYVVVANLILILENAMIIQGFTVVFAFSKSKGWALGWPIAIVIGSLFLVFPLQLVKLLGIIDLGFNLRKRMNM